MLRRALFQACGMGGECLGLRTTLLAKPGQANALMSRRGSSPSSVVTLRASAELPTVADASTCVSPAASNAVPCAVLAGSACAPSGVSLLMC